MKFINISDSILINPEKISVIQVVKDKDKSVLSVVVEGKTYTVTKMANELITELHRAGVDLTKQFFAG